MKHKGSCCEDIEDRDNDLYSVYKKIVEDCEQVDVSQAVSIAVNSPAKRFYVSEYRARIVICKMLKGKPLPHNMYPTKAEMYNEIYRRVIALREVNPNATTFRLVELAIAQPAPKFYMTTSTGITILCRIRKRKHKCQREMQKKR